MMEKALDQLIIEELAYQEAKKTGVTISEKDINNRLNEVKKDSLLKNYSINH